MSVTQRPHVDDATAPIEPSAPALPDDAPRPLPQASKSRRFASTVLPPIVLGIVLLGVWYFVSYVILDQTPKADGFLLRPPHRVLTIGFLDWNHFSDILRALWASTKVAAVGLAISVVLGISLGVLMSQAKVIERALFPYLVMLQAIPILAIAPLIGFWWGTESRSRVIVCVIISLFPIVLNTLFGLQSAERGMHDLFTLHHANRWIRLRKLMFPAALPAIFAGLRISAGLSVIGAIVGDFVFGRGDKGIGQLLKEFANDLSGEELLAAVIMSSALGVTVFLLFGFIQDRAIGKWHESSGPGR